MNVHTIPLAHSDLVGYEIGFDYWVFAPFDFKPSYWLILKREGFSGDVFEDSEELDHLTYWLNEEQLLRVYKLVGEEPGWYPWTDWLRSNLEEKILGGRVKVFHVDQETAARMADGQDPIYSSPDQHQQPSGDPITLQRNELAEELGQDIMARWVGKDKADRLHWDRWWLWRETVETYDVGAEVVDTVVDLVVGLWDIGRLVVHVVGEVIELRIELAKIEYNFARKLATGDIEGIKNDLVQLGITIGDALDSAEKFTAKVKEGYEIFQTLVSDAYCRRLIADYLSSLYQTIHYRDTRTIGVRIVSEIGIEVLLALATAGVGNVARRAGEVVVKGAEAAKAATAGRRIGPFTAKAIDKMADLARTMKKLAVRIEHKPEVKVIPEETPKPKKLDEPEINPKSAHQTAHEEKLADHHQAVDDHQATYETKRDEAIANNESNRTSGAYQAKVTEAKGERAAANYMSEHHPDAQMVRGFEPGTGFDQVWVKRTPDGTIDEYIIVEAKGPGAKLSTNANKGPQMSQEWVENTLKEMRSSSNSSASQLGKDITDAIELGPPPQVSGIGLEAVEQNGVVTGAKEVPLPEGNYFN